MFYELLSKYLEDKSYTIREVFTWHQTKYSTATTHKSYNTSTTTQKIRYYSQKLQH